MSIYTYYLFHKISPQDPSPLIFRYFFNFCFVLQVFRLSICILVDKFLEFLHAFSGPLSPLFL